MCYTQAVFTLSITITICVTLRQYSHLVLPSLYVLHSGSIHTEYYHHYMCYTQAVFTLSITITMCYTQAVFTLSITITINASQRHTTKYGAER